MVCFNCTKIPSSFQLFLFNLYNFILCFSLAAPVSLLLCDIDAHTGWHHVRELEPAAILRDPSKRPDTFLDLKSIEVKIREVCIRTY